MILRRNKKEYWEMSPLEKQIAYKDLTFCEMRQLHNEEMNKLAQKQRKQQNKMNETKKQEQELQKQIEKAIEE